MQASAPSRHNQLINSILAVLDMLFLITIILAPAFWIYDPFHLKMPWGLKPVALIIAPFSFLLLRSAIKGKVNGSESGTQGLWERGWVKKLALPFAAIFIFFALLEMALVLSGFKIDMPPIIFEGKDLVEKKEDPAALLDPELLYRFNPGRQFYGRIINRMGYREREVHPVKKSGTRRVICLGDSITGQGNPGYAQYLHEKLAADPPSAESWEAFNMAVYGYSSLQGLRLFQTEVKQLHPDIVTLYFGWNDHWLCDVTDSQRMAIRMKSAWAAHVLDGLRQKRFFMLLTWALNPSRQQLKWRGAKPRPYRVPPDEYRATLTKLVHEIRSVDAVPVIITAPRRHVSSSKKASVISPEQAAQAHDQYVAITRAVAAESHAELVDLAALFSGPECDRYFAKDGIHFDLYPLDRIPQNLPDSHAAQPGLTRIADELHKKITEIARRNGLKGNAR